MHPQEALASVTVSFIEGIFATRSITHEIFSAEVLFFFVAYSTDTVIVLSRQVSSAIGTETTWSYKMGLRNDSPILIPANAVSKISLVVIFGTIKTRLLL